MSKKSAGLLLFREGAAGLEVLLVHPGGPFWARKDEGAWSIPKGEFADDEEPLTAAKREFEEETGVMPVGEFLPLEPHPTARGQAGVCLGSARRLRHVQAEEQYASRWSGRRNQGSIRNFPRSIEQNGSEWSRRG